MSIVKTLGKVITDELHEQGLRRAGIKFKQEEIIKYNNFIKKLQERIVEIEKEVEEAGSQILKLMDIKKQLEEADKEAPCKIS